MPTEETIPAEDLFAKDSRIVIRDVVRYAKDVGVEVRFNIICHNTVELSKISETFKRGEGVFLLERGANYLNQFSRKCRYCLKGKDEKTVMGAVRAKAHSIGLRCIDRQIGPDLPGKVER